MKQKYAKYLLEKNRNDYNEIAETFNRTRDWIPPDFNFLKQYINKGEKILDIGCGNGRFSEIVKDRADYYGVDVSERLIKIAKEKYPARQFLVNDPLVLPFEENSFDKVFCLAVLHHIPSRKLRKDFLKEIKRVLKPRGKLILTVWDLNDQPKAKQLLFKYTLLKLMGKSKIDYRDIFYPWKNSKGEVLIERYVRVFSKKGLKKLIKKADFIIREIGIVKRSKKGKNIFLIAQAPKKS
ncbi:MAG: class I SAM-dependent methyltransferase [Patescibacteria group bacterium]|nr:class I SAM-dependent methyltransferase [Patescibacteria group bacterium]